MTSDMQDTEDWSLFRSAVADHQIRTALSNSFLNDPIETERDLARIKEFHKGLAGNASAEELSELTRTFSRSTFAPLQPSTIEQLRRDMRAFPIRFTDVESPANAAILARSFARVSRLAFRDGLKRNFSDGRDRRFLFATDARYRPHASVQEWAPDHYLVLMSTHLIVDVRMLAKVVAGLVFKAVASFAEDSSPWESLEFPDTILETARANPWLYDQIGYLLCAASEGERYRFGVLETNGLEQSDELDRLTGEISAGALDFLVGHELAHVALGHVDGDRPYELREPWYVSNMTSEGIPEWAIQDYVREYWHIHGPELEADTESLLYTGGDGETGAWDLRLMGAQMAISLISFTDRAKFLMDHGRDPADQVGLRKYVRLGILDLLLPKATHPWGKTRQTSLGNLVRPLYGEFFSESELERKSRLMQSVGDLLGSKAAQALQVVRWISSQSGEFLAMPGPDERLVTLHWPSDFSVEQDEPAMTVSVAAKFYGDVDPSIAAARFVEVGEEGRKNVGDTRNEQQPADASEVDSDIRQLMRAVEHMRAGRLTQQVGDYRATESHYCEALSIFERFNDKLGKAEVYLSLGAMHHVLGGMSEAEDWYQKALAIFVEVDDKRDIASAYYQLGMLAKNRGRDDEAETRYNSALSIFREQGDQASVAGIYHELGTIALDRGDLSGAERLYRLALRLKEEVGEGGSIAGTIIQLGRVSFQAGDYEEADRLFFRSLKVFEKLRDPASIAICYSNLGDLRVRQGGIEQGVEYYTRALTIRMMIGVPQARSDLADLNKIRSTLDPAVFRAAVESGLSDRQDTDAFLAFLAETQGQEETVLLRRWFV